MSKEALKIIAEEFLAVPLHSGGAEITQLLVDLERRLKDRFSPSKPAPLTKQEVLSPNGQKFGIGDLVRAKSSVRHARETRQDLEVGALYRVVGSYPQRGDQRRRSPSDAKAYEVVHVDSRETFAWVHEEHLELVPEAD